MRPGTCFANVRSHLYCLWLLEVLIFIINTYLIEFKPKHGKRIMYLYFTKTTLGNKKSKQDEYFLCSMDLKYWSIVLWHSYKFSFFPSVGKVTNQLLQVNTLTARPQAGPSNHNPPRSCRIESVSNVTFFYTYVDV